jgi:hypothetical protein
MTSGLLVSIEIGTGILLASAVMMGNTRLHSSAALTALAPGRVDSPPTSMIAAPSRTALRVLQRGRRHREHTAVGEGIGCDVEHPHHEGGVELQAPAATVERVHPAGAG